MREETQGQASRSLIQLNAASLSKGMDAIKKSEGAIFDELYLFSAVYSVVSQCRSTS